MSLSWRKQLYVALCPDGVGIVTSRGRRGIETSAVLEVPGTSVPTLAAPLAVFRQWLEQAKDLDGVNLHVTLSDNFVRYALVPDAKQISSTEEFSALAKACLEAMHGGEIGQCTIACEPWAREQSVFACAIHSDDLMAVRSLCQERRLHLQSLQPAFVRAINHSHRKVYGPAILLMPGARSITGAIWDGKGWRAVWQQPLAFAPTAENLSAIFRRESVLRDVADDAELIVFVGMQPDGLDTSSLDAKALAVGPKLGRATPYPLSMAAMALPA